MQTMTKEQAAVVMLMHQYLRGVLDPFISLLEIHKLMYFMEVAGEPLQLRLAKGPYGPYAENLRHVLIEIDGHYVSGYGADGDRPDKPLELVPGAVEKARLTLESHPETRERFERVSRLVEGFESSFGMELLATVHWVMEREGASTEAETLQKTYAWGGRKKRFSENQVRLARKTLMDQGWLSAI